MARVRNTFWRKQIDKLVQSENIPVVFKQYLNFGTTGGEPGYGFRDNAGTIQFKNSGGSWTDLGSGGSASAWGGITGTLSDQTDLKTALDAKQPLDADLTALAAANNSTVLANTTASFTTTDETKLDYITVTQAVDLDAIETRVNALDAAVVLKGSWDASAGTFPGSGTAQAGDSYIVSVGGTVNGVVFTANDRIVAITDNASTTIYASNWLKLDYTDQVLSVAGKTGAVTLATADITDITASAAELNTLDGITATVTELNYTDGVTSNIQTQLDAKLAASALSDTAYGAGWNGDTTHTPTKNAVYDEMELRAPKASPTFTGNLSYVYSTAGVVNLSNLGATETIDFTAGVEQYGTLDSDVTITHSNEASGRKVTLYLTYSGAKRAITWSDVDVWLNGIDGVAPDEPGASGNVLVVTLSFIGTTCYASATGNYTIYP